MKVSLGKLALLLVCCAINLAHGQRIHLPKHLFAQVDHDAMHRWADSVYRSLDERERLAQLIMPIIYPSSSEARITYEESRTKQHRWGGVLYQKGLISEQATMNQRLQKASRVPMLIALDGEWGLYMRLKDAPRYPRNMGLAQSNDPQLLYNYGREVARQCRIMGIHVNFAPTVDVNINPSNPVIGTRSFGDNPKQVAKLALAYARGLEDGHVLSVAKHFPGHGDTSEDSHKTLPTVVANRERMHQVELYPFARYIDAGLGGIMTGHLNVPAFEPNRLPSSLSRHITYDLLQSNMKFRGLIFTDGLEMQGVQASDIKDIGVAALLAGNDILLGPSQPEAQLSALVKAAQEQILPEEVIRAKVLKVLYYKYRLIISLDNQAAKPNLTKELIWTPSTQAHVRKLWLASLHYLRRNKAVEQAIKTNRYKRIAIIQVGKNPSRQTPTLAHLPSSIKVDFLESNNPRLNMNRLDGYDCVLFSAFEANNLPHALINQVALSRPTILVYYTSPYKVKRQTWHTGLSHVIVAGEATREAQQAIYDLFFPSSVLPSDSPQSTLSHDPEEDPTAQMTPSPLPTSAPMDNRHRTPSKVLKFIDQANEIIDHGLSNKAYPGGQLYIMHEGHPIYSRSFGTLMGLPSDSVSMSTIYDVASITKALALTPALMLLVADKRIDLNYPISRYLDELRNTAIGKASLRSLLLHQSGLPPGLNFVSDLIDPTSNTWFAHLVSPDSSLTHSRQFAQGLYISSSFAEQMIKRISTTPLRGIGAYRYSDLGFILLHQVVERISGEPLDRFLEQRLYKPIGAKVYFNPISHGISMRQIAPSQYDQILRKQIVRGTVDDEAAACLGGISGNAGLFASAPELAKVAQLLCNQGQWEGKQIIPSDVVKSFTISSNSMSMRVLGFDKPQLDNPKFSFNPRMHHTIGHLGFTGTAFWIDLDKKLVFVFLSNRTYPSRQNNLLNAHRYRLRLYQAVYDAI